MNATLASTRPRRARHSTRQIVLGLFAASIALPVLSLASHILFWAPVSHFTGLTGFLSVMPAMGALYMPFLTFPIILAIIYGAGGPLWLAARAYGFDGYSHAAIAGTVVGGTLSVAQLVFLRGGHTDSTLREVLEFGVMVVIGALTGLIARKAAGAPVPPPDASSETPDRPQHAS